MTKSRTPLARAAILTAVAAATPALAQVKAFPEAEGFGRYATGARTNLSSATVYHVTNLNDSGAGSFRDAVSQPNRFVVFDVSGVARLTSGVIPVQDNVTIAGQTAPGGGFSVYGDRLSYTSADNTITRYLRVRKGSVSDRNDAVSLARGSNMIFDHMSVTWGNDETFSMNPDSGFNIDNITIQNTIIGQGLDNVNHSAGGLMTINDGRFSVLRSLFIDNETRNPKVRGNNQFVNNVVYNWVTAAYIMGDTTATSNANIEGNYLIQGPQAGGSPFSSGTSSFHVYANNNFYDSNRDGVLNGSLNTSYPGADVIATPHDFPRVGTDTPQQAYARIVNQVGPSLYRDEVDTRIIQELTSLGTLGQIVVRETDGLYPGYPNPLPSPPKPTDTDNDGIPDTWETAHGLNPADATDWKQLGLTGYTRLEEYVNELVSNHTDKVWSAPSGTWPTTASWTGGTPTWDEDAFVRGNGVGSNGNVTVATATPTAFRLFIGGNGDAATGEKVTVNSGGTLSVLDTIWTGYENTAALEINSGGVAEATNVLLGNVVGGTTYAGTVTLNAGGTLRAGRIVPTVAGGGSIAFNGGTLLANANPVYSAPATLSAAGGTLDSNGFSGAFSGNISGSGALTKKGAGAIDLTGTNSFTGGVILQGGSLGVGSDAQLGGAATPITFSGGLLRINGTAMTTLGAHPINFSTFNGGFDIAASGNTFTVAQAIGGSGSVTKAGAGTLILGGTNSFSGGTTIQAGTLAVSADANLGANSSPVAFAGGTLRITGTTLANLDNHPPTFSAATSTIDIATAAHVFTINQSISGSGGITKAGPGTLVLAADNSFSGPTGISAGTLRLGNAFALRNSTVNLTTAGATLDLNGLNATLGGLAGNQQLDLKGLAVSVGNNGAATSYSGAIVNSGGASASFTKMGAGILTLTGSSTFTGPFILKAGQIEITSLNNAGAAGPLGAGNSAAAFVLDGGRLRYIGSGHTSNRLFTLGPSGGTIDGAGSGGLSLNSTGAFAHEGAGNRTLFLSGTSQNNSFFATLTDVDPTDVTKGKTSLSIGGTGRWILDGTGTRTYSGDTTVNTGTLLTLSSDNMLPFGAGKGNLVLGATGVFEMNSRNLNINGLSGSGNINNRTNARTLTLGNGNASASFSGTITNVPLSGTSTLNLRKIGSGTQTISGAQTYAGTTTISGGVLSVATLANGGVASGIGQSSNAAANLVLDGGTLRYTGAAVSSDRGFTLGAGSGAFDASGTGGLTLGNTAAVAFSGTGNRTLTLTGTATAFNNLYAAIGDVDPLNPTVGRVSLAKSGSGTWRLFGTPKTYSGDTTIDAGTLYLGVADVLPKGFGKGNVIVNAGATLDMSGNSHAVNGLSGAGTVTTTSNTTRTLTVGNGDADGNFSGTLTQGAAQTLNLSKVGGGTQTIAGTVAHRGVTTVSGGRLVVAANMTATSAVNVGDGATLEVAANGGRVLRAPALSIAGTGRIDLKDNKLITDAPAGAFDGTQYGGVQGMIARAYNFGAWDHAGLTTSMPDAAAGLTTIGLASGAQMRGLGATDTDTFAGQTISGASTIAMYTYAGDANLDGTIDGGDYGIIDNFVQLFGADGYANGDFNYDGVIDGGDYGIIDNNIQAQGAPFNTSDAVGMRDVTAVPEPASPVVVMIAGLVAAGTARHRRRHRVATLPCAEWR